MKAMVNASGLVAAIAVVIRLALALSPTGTPATARAQGGLVGHHEGGDITAGYWDTQTSGQVGSYGGIGKTTAELQSPAGCTGGYAEWNRDLDGDGSYDTSGTATSPYGVRPLSHTATASG